VCQHSLESDDAKERGRQGTGVCDAADACRREAAIPRNIASFAPEINSAPCGCSQRKSVSRTALPRLKRGTGHEQLMCGCTRT
jgi:hypothetical protein